MTIGMLSGLFMCVLGIVCMTIGVDALMLDEDALTLLSTGVMASAGGLMIFYAAKDDRNSR